jgi:hypothetical protein
MSSVLNCIRRLAAAGKISDQQARDAEAIYGRVFQDDLLQKMPRADAEAHAAVRVAEVLTERARQRKLALARGVNAYTYAQKRLREHPDGAIAGFMGMLDRDIRNRPGDKLNASGLDLEYYRPQLAAKMHEFDSAYRSTMAGLRQDTNGIRNMIREVFGERSGDEMAAAAAKAWKNATEWATVRAKAFGRNFQENGEWRLPQFWTAARVEKFGASEFRADLQRWIDKGSLEVHDDMGRKVTDPAARAKIVDQAVRDIRMDLSRKAGPGTVFKDQQRTFQFNRSDAYLDLMDKYGPGQGGYYSMMQGHAEKMARELALMHVFGPSYRPMTKKLLDDALKLQAERGLTAPGKNLWGKVGDKLLSPLESPTAAKRLQEYMTGQLGGVENELMAGLFAGTRSFLTSTNMGSALVTAVPTDSVNWLMAANYRGLSMGRIVGGVVDNLTNAADKEAFATRLGITAHAASRAALGTKQFGDQLFTGGALATMKGLADTVIRAQGLHAWDMAINRAFTMEFLATLGDHAGKGFADLPKDFAGFLKDYGFTADEWSRLAAADRVDMNGAKFLRPDSLDDGLRAKLMSAIGDEKQFAFVAGGSNRVRAWATGGTRAGTFAGELQRNLFLFKQFPLTLMATHGVRAVQGAANGQWGQIAALGLFMTMAGAVALQARETLQGKDPRAMNDGDFWLQAAFQGGALGIYGDFVKDAFSRSDSSLVDTLAGPVFAEVAGAANRLTSSAYREAEDGAPTSYGAELAKDVQRFAPGSTLWYTRLLANRFLFDQIRAQLDPDYLGAFQREVERQQKNYGTGYWWGPGETAPSRASAFGGS